MNDKKKNKIELVKKAFEYKTLKKYKEAIDILHKALKCEEDVNDDVEIHSFLGQLHLLLNDTDSAFEEFQNALSINPEHVFSLINCYDIYFNIGEIQKAFEISQKLCEIDRSAFSYCKYIKALIKMNKNQEALEVFNSLSEEIKLDSDLLYLISTISDKKRKIVLERIIKIDEYNEQANLDLVKIEYEAKNYSKVIKYCLNLDDENPLGNYYLGLVEAEKGNYSKAVNFFTKAIKFDNDEHDIYFDLAKAYIDISWISEAYSAIKKSISYAYIHNDNKNMDEKYFINAWLLIKLNKTSQALLNLSLIKKESALYNSARILEQIINIRSVNLAGAKTNLENFYKKDKNNLILIDTLALIYKELKLYKKAIEMYNKALAIYPKSIYYNLEKIDLLIDDRNYEEALKLINKLSARTVNCPSIYNSLARIYYRLSNYEEALHNVNLYLKLDKNNPETYYFKGLILNDLNRYDEAKNSLYYAIKLRPDKAKYYCQMARSYCGINDLESGLLYAKEAIELDENEIRYKKMAFDIASEIGNKEQIRMYENQLKRSEKILKMIR